ncbi:MAG: ABC transporter ATP-binding protein [Clostridium argentinense]|uniref:ABC transporter ATP-binding protein n=1 Tax=Clostridium faecium TaxID=2762223 RepID=A0ABR8YQY5_9CLOT|nr:ABC transporter ATP-binding protein [Clostridium faecium]MBD8046657.1 ABC transporter ATP-binding protein [Clostridium faecium]MBS5824329.1 ABC transporter ATP-binding protein [Clostridium argentinense]MDU1350681.1 ABC transporter ATP-binding protein [Clostridium argentinense]
MKKYFYEIKFFIFMRILCDGIMALSIAAIPALQKQLFDLLTGEVIETNSFTTIIIIYVVCLLSSVIFCYLSMIFAWKATLNFEQSLKRDFFKSIFSYSYEDFSAKDVGEYISIQGNDITALDQDYLTPLIDIIQATNKIIIFGVFLFINVDWRISTIILVGSILTIIIPKLTSKPLATKRNAYLEQMGSYVSKIKDFLEGFKVIQSRTRESINKEHEKALVKTKNMRFKYGKFKCLSMALEHLSLNFVSAIAFTLAAVLLLKREITMGTAVATFGYINSFIEPINDIMYDLNAVSSLKLTKEKVLSYVKKVPNDKLTVKKQFNSDIVFDNVTFKHNNFSLEDINCRFEKGKKYALIGHNGSGKSTLINMLMSYINPTSGTIKIDGENINSLDTANIMYCVNQNEHIFSDNFMNNATVFSSYAESDVNKVTDNLKIKIVDVIKSKKNSQQLSGGEKQVLGIIRMLTANTEICLMDEPFAATDVNITELLENALLNMEEKTIIMVTHKLSKNLDKFDEVILMDSGKIVQRGTFEEISKMDEFKKLKKLA